MSVILFDVEQFRVQFPAFGNTNLYSDDTLQMYWSNATCYISNENYGYLQDDCRRLALNQMTAHLVTIAGLAEARKTPGLVQSGTIDKVTVSLTPPPLKNQWGWWLSLTPYGQQLWALLQNRSVGGWYIGGRPELSVFRRPGGFC